MSTSKLVAKQMVRLTMLQLMPNDLVSGCAQNRLTQGLHQVLAGVFPAIL